MLLKLYKIWNYSSSEGTKAVYLMRHSIIANKITGIANQRKLFWNAAKKSYIP